MKNIRNITVSAIILAISFIFLYMTSIMPSAKLACLCIATAGICIIILETNLKMGIIAAVAMAVFASFFVHDKMIALLTVMFFSYYPVIKLLAERRKIIIEWIIKVLYFILITIAAFFVFKATKLLPEMVYEYINKPFILIGGGAAVVLVQCIFDIALSMMISFYMSRIMPKTKKIR